MPGICYLLDPVMRTYDAAHHVDAVFASIIVGRTIMWTFALATIALTVLLGRTRSKEIGWVAGALLSGCIVFVGRTLEIRPDVPAVAFWTASSWTLVMGLQSDPGSRRRWWALSGLCLGGTLLFTQKALFVGPGLGGFAIVYLFASEKTRAHGAKLIDLVVFGVCSAAPLLGMAVHYWSHGALMDLVNGVLVNNLGWIQETTAARTLDWMLLRDPLLSALAVGGAIRAAFDAVRDEPGRAAHAALLLPAASVMAGLAIIPAPFPQYLLLVLPIASVYAAELVCNTLSPAQSESVAAAAIQRTMGVAAFVLVGIVALAVAQPFFRTAVAYPLLGAVVVGLAAFFARRHQPGLAIVVVVLGVNVYSAQQLLWMRGASNREALDEMRFIYDATSANDTVMDGFSGVGWFRPHASFHWFVTPAVQAKLSPEQRAAILEVLETCGKRPQIVILDRYLSQLSPAVSADVAANYEATRYPTIWVRHPSRCAT